MIFPLRSSLFTLLLAIRATQAAVAMPNPADFLVKGDSLPVLKEKIQDSYSGKLSVSASQDESEQRKLFFWYFPSSNDTGSDSLTIWLGSGLGCSSVYEAFDGFSPLSIRPREKEPKFTGSSWTTLSDVLFIDQPVSVGYSSGELGAKNELEAADQTFGFLVNFYRLFPDAMKKKLFIGGQYYSGYTAPLLANRIVTRNAADNGWLGGDINLQGVILSNPWIGHPLLQTSVPAYEFANAHKDTLKLSGNVLADIKEWSDGFCGYKAIQETLSAYPPNGTVAGDIELRAGGISCITERTIRLSAQEANACFSAAKVSQTCPRQFESPLPQEVYLSREDVQAALHISGHGNFSECNNIFFEDANVTETWYSGSPNGITVLPSLTSLPRGVTILSGMQSLSVIGIGTRLVLQNTTWADKQGFQSKPTKKLKFNGKDYGLQHAERGLALYEINDAGLYAIFDEPELSLEIFKTVLGKGDTFVAADGSGGNGGEGGGDAALSFTAPVTALMIALAATISAVI